MGAPWPLVKLGDILDKASRPVSVDVTKSYRLLGVRLDGKGPFLREEVSGAETSAARFYQVAKGDFIYSRLFAWRGAFGVIDDKLDGCYVSNEFPIFTPRKGKLDVRFLRYWFSLPKVLEKVSADCTGSTPLTRNRYKENFFLDLEIPLPSVSNQKRIVEKIENLLSAIRKALNLKNLADEQISALSDSARIQTFGKEAKNDWVPLSHFVKAIENGKSPQCENRPAGEGEWGVLKVGAVSFGHFDPNENKALPLSTAPHTDYIVKSGDFLMSRANTTELVGACAIVEESHEKLLLSDKIFRFKFHQDNQIIPKFLDQILKSPALREQIETQASGTSPTMKNISKKKVFELLIPNLSIQDQAKMVSLLDDFQRLSKKIRSLQDKIAKEVKALLPSLLDKAFKGEL